MTPARKAAINEFYKINFDDAPDLEEMIRILEDRYIVYWEGTQIKRKKKEVKEDEQKDKDTP